MSRWKCLTCSRVLSDKYTHIKRTYPPHQKFIQIDTDGEEEMSDTQRWTKAPLEDEIAGLKTMKIKISTHKAIAEISTAKEGSTYDDVILMCINSYHREKGNSGNGYDPLEQIATNEEE